jgi:hypothetical protein
MGTLKQFHFQTPRGMPISILNLLASTKQQRKMEMSNGHPIIDIFLPTFRMEPEEVER